jgi:hypothetical protein
VPRRGGGHREQDLGGQLRHRPRRRDGLALSEASRWPAAG